MRVVVITKPGCPRCLLAKEKLKRLGVGFSEDSSIVTRGGVYPEIWIDGVSYGYAGAMRELKRRTGNG